VRGALCLEVGILPLSIDVWLGALPVTAHWGVGQELLQGRSRQALQQVAWDHARWVALLVTWPCCCSPALLPRYRGVSKKKGKWEAKVMVNRRWAYRELFDRWGGQGRLSKGGPAVAGLGLSDAWSKPRISQPHWQLSSRTPAVPSLHPLVQRGGGCACVRPRAVAPQAQGGALVRQLQGRGEWQTNSRANTGC